MPSAARHHVSSLDDYLAAEAETTARLELCDGQILVMAGGSLRHNLVESRTGQALAARLPGSNCLAMTSNQRIATPDGLYTYADGSVFCGEIAEGPGQTALNPTLLFEVLSDSTREYDRGEKLERYKAIPSLRHILLIEPEPVDVEHWWRAAGSWRRKVHTELADRIPLDDLGIELPIEAIYAGAARLPA